MKILIIEAYSAANIGSGALVENSVALLRKEFPEAEIEILAQSPPSIAELTKLPTWHELLTLPLNKNRIFQILWLMRTGTWMTFHTIFSWLRKIGISIPEVLYTYNRHTLNAIRKIKAADMVVSVGAERINDNFYKAVLFSLYMLRVVKGYKKFLVMFPQTVGPFHFSFTRWLSKRTLCKCDVLYLRDQRSVDIVEELKVKGPYIVRTCDVAVVQPAVDKAEARNLLTAAGIPDDQKPLLGISVMKWTYIKAEGSSGYSEYCRSIAETADRMIEEQGLRVAFIATNILTAGCREDDVAAAQDIMALMRNQGEAVILSKVYAPAQIKGIMGLMDMCLVTRMHACIFCTGICTPTASINYQFKLHEYMIQMGLGDYTIDIDQITIEKLYALSTEAWNKRTELRGILEKSVAHWSNDLYKQMDDLPKLFQQYNA